MPFTPTNIEPDPNSKVTVTFGGLMLLRPGANNNLEVGIHRLSPIHSFQVLLIVNKPGLPPRLVRLFSGPLSANFEMVVSQPGAGVQKFVSDSDEFDRFSDKNNLKDFRWAFNFAALPRHQGVNFNNGAKPIATLNSGVLYSTNLTRKGLDVKSQIEETRLNRFSADVGASVDLPPGATMTLKWTESGTATEVILPRASDSDPQSGPATYTVALLNDPPISDPSPHDEFVEYYKILQIGNRAVPSADQVSLVLPPQIRSDEIPCLIGVLDPPSH